MHLTLARAENVPKRTDKRLIVRTPPIMISHSPVALHKINRTFRARDHSISSVHTEVERIDPLSLSLSRSLLYIPRKCNFSTMTLIEGCLPKCLLCNESRIRVGKENFKSIGGVCFFVVVIALDGIRNGQIKELVVEWGGMGQEAQIWI